MKFRLELDQNWRPDRRRFFTPGAYRVPEDMSEADAELAIKAGARRVEAEKRPALSAAQTIGAQATRPAVAPDNTIIAAAASKKNGGPTGADSERSSRPRGRPKVERL